MKRKMVFLLTMIIFGGSVLPAYAYIKDYKVDGGIWSFGVGTRANIFFRQESNYYHPSKRHYANAMMNNEYSGRVYAAKGQHAISNTKYYFGGWSTNRSYYGF